MGAGPSPPPRPGLRPCRPTGTRVCVYLKLPLERTAALKAAPARRGRWTGCPGLLASYKKAQVGAQQDVGQAVWRPDPLPYFLMGR